MSRRAQTSAAKRGTPAAAVLAGGIRGVRDELTSIATRNIGDVVELVERANYRGTQAPAYLEPGTRVTVNAHVENPAEATLVTIDVSPSWVAYIPPSTIVRVVRPYQPAGLEARGETDPLLRGVPR